MIDSCRLSWTDTAWGTPLVAALVQETLPGAVRGGRRGLFSPAAHCAEMDPALLEALLAEMPAERRAAWAPLRRAGARVVVTGQQPGCAAGALLVLYKAATAVALAARAAAALGAPVVPVFWNATDDEDFEEIARVGWFAGGRELEYLELPRDGRRPGGWVGDLPAAGDAAAAAHALSTLVPGARAALARFLPEDAADHGEWVGALLARVFPELAILDARSLVLRRAGAPLFARYLAAAEAATAALEESGAALRSAGFSPPLEPVSASRALFLTPERRRVKQGEDSGAIARAAAEAPEHLSPNVVLRPLLQDSVLPVISQVAGPAEVAYLLQLDRLRERLQVPTPALVVRASCTLIHREGYAAARALRIAPADLLRDPDEAFLALARERAPHRTLREAFARLQRDLAALRLTSGGRARAGRRLQALEEELLRDLEGGARAALVEEHPALASLPGLLRPRARPQERQLAGLWALAGWGEAAHGALVQLAAAHLEALAAGRGEHALAVL